MYTHQARRELGQEYVFSKSCVNVGHYPYFPLVSSYLVSFNLHNAVITPIMQMGKLRLMQMQQCARSHQS